MQFELLACDYVQLDKSWNYRNITSTFYRLYYIDRGEGKLYNRDSSIVLEPGFIYLIPSFTECSYKCDEYLSHYFISFAEISADGSSMFSANRKLFKTIATDDDIAAIKKILALNPERGLNVSYDPDVYEKNKALTDSIGKNSVMLKHRYVATSGLLLQLIARFLEAPAFSNTVAQPINALVADALYYIQTNLHAEITVGLLAKRANKTPDHFSRLFVQNTGELPLAYIQIKRIERARLLLSTTNMTFYEIATETGFTDLSYFARIFKKITGKTPGEYKRSSYMP
ncbi:MAG: AraC family transcriptional regulator [Sphingobacteriaceae bacterium]|nr:MAG: AraC family transcriptional regulator [Sphingobacteriaceae bacterium]